MSGSWPRLFHLTCVAVLLAAGLGVAPAISARTESPPTASVPPPTEALAPTEAYIPETGHYLRDPFRAYWVAGGGAARYGYPISEAFPATGQDGITRTVQLFDRARFELHRIDGAEVVLLGLLGLEELAGVTYPRAVPADAAPGVDYFAATGHLLGYGFRDFWYGNDGVQLLGLPLSDEFVVGNRTVQYFERGRLEYDPLAPPASAVSMAPLGADLVARIGWTPPSRIDVAIDEPAPAQGSTFSANLRVDGATAISAQFDDRPVPLFGAGGAYVARVGLPPWITTGAHRLTVVVDDARGFRRLVTRRIDVQPTAFPRERLSVPPDQSALLDPAVLEAELGILSPLYALETPSRYWTGPFILPVQGPITTAFGELRAYNDGPFDSFHGGLDIGAPAGTPVLAAAAGRVVFAGTLAIRGDTVVIDHGQGVLSLYFHQSSLAVSTGLLVAAGATIGYVGSTGLSTGPHLHWEVRVGGEPVSPWQWVTGVANAPDGPETELARTVGRTRPYLQRTLVAQ